MTKTIATGRGKGVSLTAKTSTATPGCAPLAGEMADQKLLLRAVIDQIPDFLFVKDTESRFVVANTATAKAYGTTSESLVGKSDFDLHPETLARHFFDIEQDVVRSGVALKNLEETFPDAQGADKWYQTTKVPLRDGAGRVVGLVGVARDITERKQMEALRHQQGVILEMIAKNAPLKTVLDHLVRLIESQLSGIRASIALADVEAGVLRPASAPSLPESYLAAIDGVAIGPQAGSCGAAAYRGESVVVSDIWSDPLWEGFQDLARAHGLRSCWATPVLSHEGGVLGTFALYSAEVRFPTDTETLFMEMVGRIAGIAIERQRSQDRILFMAHHDALTELPNRGQLSGLLSEALGEARSGGHAFSVVFVDLDHFKLVNDSLGHVVGDALLKAIAARMLGCAGAFGSVVRLGGDEFVVLLREVEGGPSRSELIGRLKAAVSEPLTIDGHHLRPTCSVGVASFPQDGRDAATLLKNADAAMYFAKGAGRDRLEFYTAEMNEAVRERVAIQDLLRTAIECNEMFLLYQPQVDLRSGRMFATEALLRWRNPILGLVPPAKFIPVAEEGNLIVAIGDWVLETACRQAKAWGDAGLGPLTMCVNVSPRQFHESGLAARVRQVLDDTGLDPACLELEVTESMLMQNLDKAVATMQQLKQLGVQLAIDDFGTGYSSLSALKSFPVRRLKIDRSFVRDLPDEENDRAIASAVISLGQKLGLRVIAEGVETEAQIRFLRDNNCDEMQGYLFSKPIAPGEIEAMLNARAQLAPHLVGSAGSRRTASAR